MKVVNPYLNFAGNAEEAFNFYRSVFGGEFITLMRMKDASGMPVAEGQEEKIMHIALPIGNGQVLMASDSNPSTFKEGNNYYISLHADREEEGRNIFYSLSANGKVNHPFEKQFWGSWHGNFVDKFGVRWMVNYDPQ
jgi:PhnB protein